MNSITAFLIFADPWFIAPYRWLSSPDAGFVLGTILLSFQCFLLGDLSAMVVKAFNRKYISKLQKEMDRNHDLSEKALKMGDKDSYKAVNRQALDAFGHSFSLGAAIFCVSIWPMPFALAWMHMRFANAPLELPIALPFLGSNVHYFASFILIYIPVRMISARMLNYIEGYARLSSYLTGRQKKQTV